MLFAPLRYWQIRHPVKRLWDIIFPTVGATLLTATLFLWPSIPSAYADDGYLAGLQNLYAILGGFFIAALTLVSTADTKAFRQPLTGSPAPRFKLEKAPLNRRRFLCFLFGYLAFSSFSLYAIGFLALLLADGAREIIGLQARTIFSALFLLVYNFWLSQLFVSTMLGLYYFTDRLQRPDPEIINDEINSQPAE